MSKFVPNTLAVPLSTPILHCESCGSEVCDVPRERKTKSSRADALPLPPIRVSFTRGLELGALHEEHDCPAPPAAGTPANCRGCGAPIRWELTANGRPTPVNADGEPHWATCPDANQFRERSRPKKVEPAKAEPPAVWNGENSSPSEQREARKATLFD